MENLLTQFQYKAYPGGISQFTIASFKVKT